MKNVTMMKMKGKPRGVLGACAARADRNSASPPLPLHRCFRLGLQKRRLGPPLTKDGNGSEKQVGVCGERASKYPSGNRHQTREKPHRVYQRGDAKQNRHGHLGICNSEGGAGPLPASLRRCPRPTLPGSTKHPRGGVRPHTLAGHWKRLKQRGQTGGDPRRRTLRNRRKMR